MKSRLIAVAIALLPAAAMAQPRPAYDSDYPHDHYRCRVEGCDDTRDRAPPCVDRCASPADRDAYGRLWRGPDDNQRGAAQGYYRDYYPAPQYGYTYGSARGRGYGYSYGDYRGPTPDLGDW